MATEVQRLLEQYYGARQPIIGNDPGAVIPDMMQGRVQDKEVGNYRQPLETEIEELLRKMRVPEESFLDKPIFASGQQSDVGGRIGIMDLLRQF